MLDFDCVACVPGNPAGTHKDSQPHAGDITVAKTVFFTFWSLEKTIWQNNEKVFVHLRSRETSLVPINSLLQPSGRIFNKALGVKYLCFLWNKSSKSNQNNQNLRLEAYGVYNFTELHKTYMLFFLKRAQESGFFFSYLKENKYSYI